MTRLIWDQPNARKLTTGVSHGVIYYTPKTINEVEEDDFVSPDTLFVYGSENSVTFYSSAVAWNGLTSVTVNNKNITDEVFLDGVKISEIETPSNTEGTIKAITYPDILEEFVSVDNSFGELRIPNQRAFEIGFSYKTHELNPDTEQFNQRTEKIHIFYNMKLVAAPMEFKSDSNIISLVDFVWLFSCRDESALGFKPTAHVVIDPSDYEQEAIDALYSILYGTETSPPRLPSLSELIQLTKEYTAITITDNLDGTWTAVGPDWYIDLVGTEFTISNVNATYSDPNTYTVETTQLIGG